jgi:Ni/Co efflux regulator RcnB
MKKALIISGFLLALSVTGCSTPQASEPQTAAPVAQPDDAARRDADRARDAQRDQDRDRARDASRDADHDRRACPDGEHLFTDRDGKTGCVRN